jgi:hypothetical protein
MLPRLGSEPISVLIGSNRTYQSANRLAHLYFLREIAKVPAWLANIYFVGDDSLISTTRADWDEKIAAVEKHLGFAKSSVPYLGDVFLPAREISAQKNGRD